MLVYTGVLYWYTMVSTIIPNKSREALIFAGLFTDETTGVISLNTTFSYESSRIMFDVYIKKDTRVLRVTDYMVTLTEGDPPNIAIG